jgi:hypothetical protein
MVLMRPITPTVNYANLKQTYYILFIHIGRAEDRFVEDGLILSTSHVVIFSFASKSDPENKHDHLYLNLGSSFAQHSN